LRRHPKQPDDTNRPIPDKIDLAVEQYKEIVDLTDYVRRIHFWISLYGVLSVIGVIILIIASMSQTS
jgi:hypothetical protein